MPGWQLLPGPPCNSNQGSPCGAPTVRQAMRCTPGNGPSGRCCGHGHAVLSSQVPENLSGMRHTLEGPDDMPAHVLASLFGTELTLAVENGRLLTGTWQGIWLGEHREHGGARKVTATLMGE